MAKAPPPKQHKIEEQAPVPDPLLTLAQLEEQARSRLGLIAPSEPGTSLETALARIAELEDAAIIQLATPEPMPLSCDRLPCEPMLWFTRFEVFRDRGVGRSLLGCYKREKGPKRRDSLKNIPNALKEAAQAWDWPNRANDYDEWQYRERRRKRALKEKLQEHAEQEERKAQAAIRRSMLNIYAGLWLDSLPKFERVEKVGLKALSDGMAAFLTQNRLEYDGEATQPNNPQIGIIAQFNQQINNNNPTQSEAEQGLNDPAYIPQLFRAMAEAGFNYNGFAEPEPTEEEEEEDEDE